MIQHMEVPMAGLRRRGEEVRAFILANLSDHESDIAAFTAKHFGISRTAVIKHLARLVEQGAVLVEGERRGRRYRLHSVTKETFRYPIHDALEEDVIWRQDLRPRFDGLPRNVLEIWQYGVTEMLNNAIEHSEGSEIVIVHAPKGTRTTVMISDDGVGIFRKIQREFNLLDERHAVLELSKGKLTTDPVGHSGEGIFFTSRIFDFFGILSGDVWFSHNCDEPRDWVLDTRQRASGTSVFMELENHSTRTTKDVFDEYASDEDYRFDKTVVSARLARYGDESLVSRSQARRVLARVEKFRTVVLDFEGVSIIGQAFADEVFRVFKRANPEVQIIPINTNPDVARMICRASAHAAT